MSLPSLVAPVALTTLATDLRSGALDLEDSIRRVCDRIDAVEPTLQALVPEPDRRARLLAQAAELHQRFPTPDTRPLLYGVLAGVKDIMRADGFETRAGSRLPPEHLTGEQADCVTRLREQGALVVGKTVTAEFAYIAPGPTRNPHNPAHTPGGSSSGSAVAVAAGYTPLALGTQTVGSVLRPAAYCGIVGFKPTRGRVSTSGIIAVSPSLDHAGILTADVDSAALAASVLCSGWTPQQAGATTLPVLGVPDGPYLNQADDEALALFEAQVARLEAAGYSMKRVPLLDNIADITEAHLALMAAEMAETHRDWFATHEPRYRPQTAGLIRQGQRVDAATATRARNGQKTLRRVIHDVMTQEQVSLWVSPAATGPAPVTLESTGNSAMSLPWTFTGMPAVTVPAGYAANGLPVGLQITAAYGQDEWLLAAAREIARAFVAG